MTKEQLEYFMLVYKYRNISFAAEKIHISRQALSRTLQDFESQIGKQLFYRTNSGIVPTEEAQKLIPHVSVILQEFEKLSALDSFFSDLMKKEITVCTIDTFSELFLPDCINEFTCANPDVLLNIEETTDQDAIDQLMLKKCDFAITTDIMPIHEFEHDFILHAKYGVLVNSEDPIANKNCIGIEDLIGRKIIGKSKKNIYYKRNINAIMKNHNLNIILEFSNSGVVENLVRNGIGVALTWDYNVNLKNDRSGIVFVPFNDPSLGFDVFLLKNKNTDLKPFKYKFRDLALTWSKNYHALINNMQND